MPKIKSDLKSLVVNAQDDNTSSDVVDIKPSESVMTICGEISSEIYPTILDGFREFNSVEADVTINLTSEGGDLTVGMAIYDLISCSKNYVTVNIWGSAGSAAVLIVQAADRRRISKNSFVYLHEPKLIIDSVQFLPKTLASTSNNLEFSQKAYNKIVANRCRVSEAKVKEWCEKESFFYAKDSVKFGLTDEIIRSM